jgi:hypothetical protein
MKLDPHSCVNGLACSAQMRLSLVDIHQASNKFKCLASS